MRHTFYVSLGPTPTDELSAPYPHSRLQNITRVVAKEFSCFTVEERVRHLDGRRENILVIEVLTERSDEHQREWEDFEDFALHLEVASTHPVTYTREVLESVTSTDGLPVSQ